MHTSAADRIDDAIIDSNGIFEAFSFNTNPLCSDGAGNGGATGTTTFSNTFVSTDPDSNWKDISYEQEAYGFDMEHTGEADDELNWKLRLGNGGQIMSLILKAGESISNQALDHARWNDLVQQMVAVNLANNTGKDCFIHGSGVYSRDTAKTVDPPFYNPQLAHKCEGNECVSVNWGQQAHVPMKWHSPIIFYTKYRDCGGGIIQYDMAMYNFGFENPTTMVYDYHNTPWTGVRTSTFPDVLHSHPDTGALSVIPLLWTWGNNNFLQLRNLDTTGGYTTFAQNVENNGEVFEFPVAGFQYVVQDNGRTIQYSLFHNNRYGMPPNTVFRMPFCDPSTNIPQGGVGWGRPGKTVTITNTRTDVSFESRMAIHYCWDGWAYMHADASLQFLKDNFLTNGDVLSVTYTYTPGTAWDEQTALTFVHGTNREYPKSGVFNAKSRVRVGLTDSGRDGTVFTTNFIGWVKPGRVYFNRKFMITDKLSNMISQAQQLVGHTEEDVFDAGSLAGTGTTITLWKDDTNEEFGATVGDENSDSCINSDAVKVCEGKSAPNFNPSNSAENSKPLFYTVCGSSSDMKFVSFDPYVNSDNKITDPDVVASYKCKTSLGDTAFSGRPTWKLLGYFIDDGSCDDLIGEVGYTYESELCPLGPLPTDPPTDPPTEPQTDPPAPCTEEASGLFLLKKVNRRDNGIKFRIGMLQSCSWLASQSNKDEICRMKVQYFQGRGFVEGTNWRDSDIPDNTLFSPAQKVCKATCISCDDACYENPHSLYLRRIKNNSPRVSFCERLSDMTELARTRWCSTTITHQGYQPAAVECPISCSPYVTDSPCDGLLLTFPPTPAAPLVEGVEYVGCYKDKSGDRALSVFMGRRKSIEECAELCSNFNYFGLQNNFECRCGNNNDYAKHGISMTCGCHHEDNVGKFRNCVYRNV